ncbi:MAG: hypothetical protein IKW90_11130, partial [Lachnospiraceae bacterium]|nr:hypothetical protein [Lachnospiraceae bacterium]
SDKPPSVDIVRLANQHYYTSGGFILEAKAISEHTCIAGGLFVPTIQKYAACFSQTAYHLMDNASYYDDEKLIDKVFNLKDRSVIYR